MNIDSNLATNGPSYIEQVISRPLCTIQWQKCILFNMLVVSVSLLCCNCGVQVDDLASHVICVIICAF